MFRRTNNLLSVIKLQINSSHLPRRTFRFFFVSQTRAFARSRQPSTLRTIIGYSRRSVLYPASTQPHQRKLVRNCTSEAAMATDRDVLPGNVKPINYDISLYDLELGGGFSYQGTVNILSKISKSSKEITLNAHQLKIHSAEVSLESVKTQQTFKATDISYDAPRQRVTLSFPEDLPTSERHP